MGQEEQKDLLGHPYQTDQKENQVITDVLLFMDLADVKDHKVILESRFVILMIFLLCIY